MRGFVSVVFGLLALLGFHLSYRLPPPGGALGLEREVVSDKGLRRALEIYTDTQSRLDTVILDLGLMGEVTLMISSASCFFRSP